MPVMDMRTLVLIAVVVSLVFALSMQIVRQVSRDCASIDFWARGSLAVALGNFLIAWRGIAPDWLSLLFANALLIWGLAHLYRGSCHLLERPVNRFLDLWLATIILLGFAGLTYLHPSMAGRIALISLLAGILFLQHGHLYLRAADHDAGIARLPLRFCAVTLLLTGWTLLVRGLLAPFISLSPDFMVADHWLQPSAFIAIIVFYMALNAALPILVMSRYQNSLSEANRKLAALSNTDGLTGIANRRHFDCALQNECQRATRGKQPLALLLIDIDHFKQYNDRYGHQAGDRALQAVARLLTAMARRPGDLTARYGGEEFAVILPNVGPGHARHLAEHLRAAVEKLVIPHLASPLGHLSISLGLAIGDGDPEQLLARADQALYQAKAQGRNRVCESSEVA